MKRPRLLALAALALPAVWYGVDQALMQRNTWPPLADPHHQAHWMVMALLAFMTVLVVAGAALPGHGWRVASLTAGAGALAAATASLLSPASASAVHPVWAVAALMWAVGVIAITWDESKRSQPSNHRSPS